MFLFVGLWEGQELLKIILFMAPWNVCVCLCVSMHGYVWCRFYLIVFSCAAVCACMCVHACVCVRMVLCGLWETKGLLCVCVFV